MIGWRKLSLAVLFGVLAFVAFFFTPKDVSSYTALVGALIAVAGWYNKSNVDEHKVKNGGKNEQ